MWLAHSFRMVAGPKLVARFWSFNVIYPSDSLRFVHQIMEIYLTMLVPSISLLAVIDFLSFPHPLFNGNASLPAPLDPSLAAAGWPCKVRAMGLLPPVLFDTGTKSIPSVRFWVQGSVMFFSSSKLQKGSGFNYNTGLNLMILFLSVFHLNLVACTCFLCIQFAVYL